MKVIYARLIKKISAENIHEVGTVLLLAKRGTEYRLGTRNRDTGDGDCEKWRETGYSFSPAEMAEHFEVIEDEDEGEAAYDAETREVKKRLRETQGALDSQSRSTLGDGRSSLTITAGEAEVDAVENLSLKAHAQNVGKQRNELFKSKKTILTIAQNLKKCSAELQVRLEAKLELAQIDLGRMEKFVKRVGSAIHSINLYLGKDEKITLIQTGARAPETSPLHIRQMVLRMDEELALAKPEGADYKDFETFEDWLKVPKHLQQIVPEQKGIVVLTARGSEKNYDRNPMVNRLMNEANFKSYWVLRNGENIHTIHADVELKGGTLFSTPEDIQDCFFEFKDGGKVPLRPGSQKYQDAMDAVEGENFRAMQTVLFLQGIIDRTLIFHPYVDDEKPNLLDPRSYSKSIRLVYDYSLSLGEGRPSYAEWQRASVEKLQHGDRIVGKFYRSMDRDDVRVHPKNAKGFDGEEIRTVEESRGRLFFKFDRTDTIWTRYGSQDAVNRGSYELRRSDLFFINVDSITAEEIEFYMEDRISRSAYMHMIPTLRRAKALLIQEREREQPFRDLLLRKLQEAESPKLPATPELVADLIRWFKEKTKEKRTLLTEEDKTYRMIMAEYGRLCSNPNLNVPDEVKASFINEQKISPLCVFVGESHRGTVTVVRLEHDESSFVHVYEFDYVSGSGYVCTKTKEWVGASPQLNRLHKVHFTHDRWTPLTKVRPGHHNIRTCDIAAARALVSAEVSTEKNQPIALIRTGDFLRLFRLRTEIDRFAEEASISLKEYDLYYDQKSGELTISTYSRNTHSWGNSHDDYEINLPWVTAYIPKNKRVKVNKDTDRFGSKVVRPTPIWENVDNIISIEKEIIREVRKENRFKSMKSQLQNLVDLANNLAAKLHREREAARWAEAGGDIGFLDDHIKTLAPAAHVQISYSFWFGHGSSFKDILKHPDCPPRIPECKSIRAISHVFMNLPDGHGESIAKELRSTFAAILDVEIKE